MEYWHSLEILVTCMLCGLIWTIQWVHYPSFAFIDRERFTNFHAWHGRRIGLLVVILMPLELAAAVIAVEAAPDQATWIGLSLVVLIWLSTALIQIPAHKKLAEGFDPDAHRRLVRGNWIRTVAWSARSLLVLDVFA